MRLPYLKFSDLLHKTPLFFHLALLYFPDCETVNNKNADQIVQMPRLVCAFDAHIMQQPGFLMLRSTYIWFTPTANAAL